MTTWLIDKSALARLTHAAEVEEWLARITRGLVHIAPVTLLELGFSARDEADHVRRLDHPPVAAMPVAFTTPRVERRALEVQRALSLRGHHRAPSVPDLLIAATAEVQRHTLLHLDKDFELIAAVTGQPQERLRAAGA